MFRERRVVNNRVFLLGLDELYREAIKDHERGELLLCARRVAAALDIAPADVPIEGYYAEDPQLTEYFRIARALQAVNKSRTPDVVSLPEFQRLLDVASSRLYGHAVFNDYLLPTGRDALSKALRDAAPDWNLQGLADDAYSAATTMDDFSLVGLAARVRDAVVLTATRESVVLYAEMIIGSAMLQREPRVKYIWTVDEELAEQARRFIDTFNSLFGEKLPPPESEQAETYWRACEDNEILGRCVRLGYNDAVSPVLQYHWAICRGDGGTFVVQDFWHSEIWTTTRYRSRLPYSGRCPSI